MQGDISTTTIRYFIRIAELHSISKAAESLFISQPTLSRQMADLEGRLHIALFAKGKCGVTLTREGKAFLEKAVQFMAAYDRFISEVANLENLMSGAISIAYQKSAEEFLGTCNRQFLQLYPNIDLNCSRQGRKNIVAALLDGEYDVVFVNSLDVEGVKNVQSFRLFSQAEWLLVPRTNPLAQKDAVSLDELKDERFIMTSHHTAKLKADLQIAACRRHGFVPNIIKYADNFDDFIMNILTYDAICFMPFMHGAENDHIKYVRVKGHETHIDTSVAWVHETETVEKYIETVRKLVE